MMYRVLAEKNDQLSKINQTSESLSGWTVIQRRFDGSVEFNRNWRDYRDGFGDPRGEFFIGLKKLHMMTAADPQELYIDLGDVDGTYRHAKYDNFIVGSEEESFVLKSLGNYSGNAGDSLREHEKEKFATDDRDSPNKCVHSYDGPWWFNGSSCGKSSLNGKYFKEGIADGRNGISWGHWNMFDYKLSLTFVKMTIRPRSPLT
ncbi:ficolin-2-like [Drosophila subobscura]|uniref:ficolin-2-like n=1 Tax=Drosophila subobscura TaxID=7241 RepID=UPI00155AC1DD|nr:ficolin-2-like [Drosophila subobscura]